MAYLKIYLQEAGHRFPVNETNWYLVCTPKEVGLKILSLFADVRRGERLTSFLLMANVFILLTAYYIIKPVREALILGDVGAEIKSYTGALQALLFLLIIPIYGSIASRVSRVRLINGVTAFFIMNLGGFYVLSQLGFRVGIPFFLWVGLFNVMLLAQVWAFANDVFTEEQGRRLFAIVGIGSSLGAIFGAYLAGRLFEPFGPYRMMLLSGVLLICCIVLTSWVHLREKNSAPLIQQRVIADRPIGGAGGFHLIFQHRYLMLIALMVLLTNLVNTTGEFILGKAVTQNAQTMASTAGLSEEQYIGMFYADFFFWVNVLGAALQLFVVSRILKYFGIGMALFVLPIVALGSYALLAFAPILGWIRITKIFENSTDYSIQNTARHALFLQTDRDAKYKAKTAIDNFFWRAGDACSALLVFAGTQLAFGVRGFALMNIILVAAWIGIVFGIIRLRKREAEQDAPARETLAA